MPTGIYIGIDAGMSITSSGSSWTPQNSIITEDDFAFITEDDNYIIQE